MDRIILDTCAVIWAGKDERLTPDAEQALNTAFDQDLPLYVSPITAWELGLMVSRGRLRLPMQTGDWFNNFLSKSLSRLVDLSADILISSSFLPGSPPNDPADRIIIATAREHDYCILTRDRAILKYASAGHVQALAC